MVFDFEWRGLESMVCPNFAVHDGSIFYFAACILGDIMIF